MIDYKKVSIDVKLEIIIIWLEGIIFSDNLSEEDIYLISAISKFLIEERS